MSKCFASQQIMQLSILAAPPAQNAGRRIIEVVIRHIPQLVRCRLVTRHVGTLTQLLCRPENSYRSLRYLKVMTTENQTWQIKAA